MKDQILTNLENPRHLEKLYRESKTAFRRAFNALYPELPNHQVADFWNERLNYESLEVSWGKRSDWLFVLAASLLAGTLARIPLWLPVEEEFFYLRNVGLLVFPPLIYFFAWKNNSRGTGVALLTALLVLAAAYINLLPDNKTSDTLLLACLHLPLCLWVGLGFAFAGNQPRSHERRLAFLRFNGDLLVITALIVLAGGLLTGMTIALFSVIGFPIEEAYAQYVLPYGLAAVPIVGTYLTQTNPQLVDKISPVIAKIFSPIVLLTLLVYLGAILYAGKDPYHDREFLLIFNLLLVGVMALILFSVAGTAGAKEQKPLTVVLVLLSLVTILINGIALSAILFRIAEWGLTPNRLAVLGGNILILIHLLLVSQRLLQALRAQTDLEDVEKAITAYLPVYGLWVITVTFIFPAAFGFE